MSETTISTKIAFESECVTVPIEALLPVRPPRPSVKASHKYQQIRGSVAEIGLVEPPVIARIDGNPDNFLLLDGHVRVEILKDLGKTNVECLVSTEDESFTFNKRISRLSAVQEHAMILKAVARGVSNEKIARALSLNVSSIRRLSHLRRQARLPRGRRDLVRRTASDHDPRFGDFRCPADECARVRDCGARTRGP